MDEFFDDRLRKIGVEFKVLGYSVNGFWYKERHNGRYDHKELFIKNPVRELVNCEMCGLLASRRRIKYRNHIYGWDRLNEKDYSFKSKTLLCTSCWNKAKPIFNAWQSANQLRTLNNKLKKGIYEWQRLQKQAN